MQTYKTYLKIPFVLVVARSNSKGIFVFKITMEKKCTKCEKVKSLDEFGNKKDGKYKRSSRCKTCDKLYYQNNREQKLEKVKEYRKNNHEKIAKYSKVYREKNKESLNKYKKKHALENKKKYKESRLRYQKDNKEAICKRSRDYYNNNKDKVIKLNTKRNKERIKKDILFKLSCGIRANIGVSLRQKGYTKKNKTNYILKCDYNFFMKWLNGVASNGYTYGIGDLHLDHVVPISLSETEEELLLLNHYSNFQLLTADENFSKGNRYVNPTNLKRVLEHHPNPDKIREIHARL